jgi:hypothetical protein
MEVPLRIVTGLLLLIFGRQLFWLFVAALGFVLGIDFATQYIPESSGLMVLLVAVMAGILGAVFAYFFYRVAIAAAGFVAGGRIGIALLAALSPASSQAMWLAFIVAGVLGAVLLLLVFDWGLIVISSLLGASVIAQQLTGRPGTSGILFVVLLIAGIVIQAEMMRRRPPVV